MTTAPVSHSNPKGKDKEKEEEEQEKEKEKEKEKQYSFEGFNIDGEGPTELMSSFSQWINGGLYKHYAKKRDKDNYYLSNCSDLEFKQLDFVFALSKKKDWFYVMSQPNKSWTDEYADVILYYLRKNVVPEYENKIVGTIKGFGIPVGLYWHLIDEVYVPVNCNGKLHWVLTVVVLKERHIKGKNKSHPFEVIHVTGIAQQTSNSLNGLQIPSDEIISQSLRLRYASILWNYGILKARSGYVSNNEDPQRARPKKSKIKVVVAIFSTTSVVICCYPLLQQGVVALIISSLSLISCQKQNFLKKNMKKEKKKKNEVDDDGERSEEVEEEKGNKKEVEEEEEQINEVDEDKGKQKEEQEKNEPNATGDSIMRSAIGKSFDTFRITLKQNGLEFFFRNSCLGHFLDLPESNNARFQMTMVYELLKRRFIFQNPEKNDEPVPEFIVKKEPRRRKKGGKEEIRQSTEEQDLMSLDIEAFNNYLWGHENFKLTVKYLLKPLGPKTNNLFGFPWAFMAWAFEVIPHLTHQVNAEEEISSPRILRWWRSKTKIAKNIPNLYNPPHDAVSYYYITPIYVATCDPNVATDDSYVATYDPFIATYDTNVVTDNSYIATNDPSIAICDTNVVHPWLVLTKNKLQMSYIITLGLVETLFDPVVDRVKMELASARTIKRDRVVNELVIFDGGDGRGIDVDQGDTSCRKCFGFLCEKCKKQDEDYIMYLHTLSQAVNEFKNKRGVKVIPSKNVRHPYTPQAKRRKKSFIKAIQNLKKKIFGELPMAVGEEVLEFKHVNVYKRVTIAEKIKLVDLARGKDLRVEYDIHYFRGEDFRIMTSMDIWWEDWRYVRYLEYYDSTDKILDLNFYFNFKLRYDEMSEEATTVGGRSFTQLINEFEWDEDMINYVKGIRSHPGGMDWIGAKRVLAIMNINKTHFVTLEILLHEGRMNVYDCLLMDMEHAKFLTFIQPVFELLSKLLKQSGIMKHLLDKFLNEPWEFKGQLEPMVTNDSKVACASYSLTFIEHLITRTTIQPPKTLLCDNAVRRMQWVWAAGIVSRSLEP
ncbi:hypothetical protein H5410_035964 [Solanum commersonii]|uniref:Ubiquitin-like protease family profile domain-containing protein n=1 Tax=Solanum commersonii TaxID=4109 RepID=A0A9J5Y671_SOLCO|nr:hypothetical protein H5410_035964 [Solanum commersonii]